MAKLKFTENSAVITGYVYGAKLEKKTVERADSTMFGKPYIKGSIDIVTDDAYKNIVTINYVFVTEVYSSGKPNSTYKLLEKIMTDHLTITENGIEKAAYVEAKPSIVVNDWISDRTGEPTIVSNRRLEGGFLSQKSASSNPYTNTFSVDTLITKARVIEANEERHIAEDYAEFSGYVFDFRGAFHPVTFVGRDQKKVDFVNSYGAEITDTHPLYCKVVGEVLQTTETYTVTVEGLFGDVEEEKTRRVNELLISNVIKPADGRYDDALSEGVDAVTEGLQNRELHLAEVKKQWEDRQAAKVELPFEAKPTAGATPVQVINPGSFKF